MAFKDEERSSGFISGYEIMRKAADERFNEYIEQVKTWTPEERVTAGRNIFVKIIETVLFLYDDHDQSFSARVALLLVETATQLGCAGMTSVSENKKKEAASFFQDFESVKDLSLQAAEFFDYKELDDDWYRLLINGFLRGTLEPLFGPGENHTYIQGIDKVALPLCRVLHSLTGRTVSPFSRPFVRVMKLFLAKKHENRRTCRRFSI